MSTIDSRIVTMKFDNTSFQKGVSSTMDILGKLKAAIGGMGDVASKGLGAVGAAATKANLAPLGAQADEVGNRFTAMSVVAVTAIATIAHSAIQAGTSFVKSFTFGPIMDGLSEYQTNLQSIQTIQANTDRPLTEITASLDELNRYSDRTIYNFSEMAKNIGTFTAAGVDLKTATSAIKGIANMAALSGSTSAQASAAMYQLSQALASGKVSLMDWNSVVNAGMGGKKLQTALAQTAVAMGELEKNAITGTAAMDTLKIHGASFRESLSADSTDDPWLSSEVLKVTLASLDGRFSKLALSTEKLEDGTLKYEDAAAVAAAMDEKRNELAKKGTVYTEEQWKMLTKLSDSSFLAATQVKTLGQVMQVAKETLASGWSATFRNIFGDFGEAKKTFTEMSGFINDGINAMALRRNNMLAKWNAMGGRDVLIESFKNAFKALSHVIQPIQRAFRDIFPRTTAKNLFAITEAIESFTKKLIMQGHTMHDVRAIFKAIFGVIAVGIEIVKGVVRYFATLIGLLSGGTGGMLDFSGSIAEIISGLTDWILKGDYIAKFFDKIISGREALLAPIIEKFSDLLKTLGGFVRLGTEAAIDAIVAAFKFLSPILQDIVEWMTMVGDVVRDNVVDSFDILIPIFKEIVDWMILVGDAVRTKLIDGFEKLTPVFTKIKDAIADAFGSLSGIGGSVGGAFSGLAAMFDIGSATDGAADGIDKVKDALSSASPVADAAKTGMSKLEAFLRGFGSFLAGAAAWIGNILGQIYDDVVATISGIGSGGGSILSGIAGFFGFIKDAIFGLFEGLTFSEVVVMLNTVLATGIVASIMRFVWQMGGIFKDMRGIFTSVGGVFDQVSDNLKTMQNDVRSDILLKIAISLGIMAAALYVLSTIDSEALGKALGALTTMLISLVGALVIIMKTMPSTGFIKDAAKLGALGAVLIGLGVALLLMAGAVYILAQLKPEELKQGLIAMVTILGGIVAASVILEKSGGAGSILRASIAIGIMAVSLSAMAAAIKLFSMLDTGMLVEGGAKIAAMLIALGIAMQFLPAQNVIAGAIALGIVAGAMILMAVALKKIAALDAGDSWQSILTLAGALTVLIIAMHAATTGMAGAQAILVMAFALAVLTPVLVTLGNMDLWSIIKAMVALALVFTIIGIAGAVLAPVVPVIAALGLAILLLGVAFLAAGTGMFLFALGLTMLAALGTAAVIVLIDCINTFLDALPGFVERIGAGFSEVAAQIQKVAPEFVHAAGVILRSLLDEVIKTIPKIGKVFRALIAEALKTLRAAVPDMIRTGFVILRAFLDGVRQNIAGITSTAVDIIVRFIDGIAKKIDMIVKAGVNLAIKFVKAVSKELISRGKGLVTDAAGIALDMALGMRDGLVNAWHYVTDKVAALIDLIPQKIQEIMGIASPSKVTRDLGGHISKGLALGIDDGAGDAAKSAANVANGALRSLRKAMEDGAGSVISDVDTTIRPVLDLSQVQKDASTIGSLLAANPLSADVSYQQASIIAAEQEAAAVAAAESEAGGLTEVKFEQNNYSPKALSHVEIHRRTKNQLSLVKEALKV